MVQQPGTITPYFTVDDADLFLQFISDLFDAKVVKDDRHPNGKVQHARALIGDSLIMLNESSKDYTATYQQMHIYVSDADASFAKAIEIGAEAIMEPNLRPHGDRMAGIKDPCGNIWWMASKV
ncbi:MAG: VOC family protein [Cognatishimia sp.]|nr:VOC family protein [Cognatishimia sp.]